MTPHYADDWLTVYLGDCGEVMAQMPAESVHCVVTSPPYWGLRDYGTATWEGGDPDCDHQDPKARKPDERRASTLGGGVATVAAQDAGARAAATCRRCGAQRVDAQLGLEPTPEQYVENMVAVFREVRRVLRSDGTVWLNLGDSYASGTVGRNDEDEANLRRRFEQYGTGRPKAGRGLNAGKSRPVVSGLKPKDLVGIPWRVAFALQADGWYLRSDIIWSKPNPMPESVTDRPTKAHEYLFLLSKSARYYYDADAVREGFADERMGNPGRYRWTYGEATGKGSGDSSLLGADGVVKGWNEDGSHTGRNIRSVWTIDYNTEEEVEWTNAIGSCRRCGGLRVAGIGSEPTTSKATGGSRHPGNEHARANSAPTASPTSFWSDPSDPDSPSTTSAATEDASTPPISSRFPSETTSSEATPQPLATSLRPAALRDTSTPRRTLIDALTASGSAVCACGIEQGDSGQLSSVLTVATAPYKGAHFATFPPKLVEPCIKAGTSERGVCPECGAPWERVVEKGDPRPVRGEYLGPIEDGAKLDGRAGFHGAKKNMVRTTEGWSYLKRDNITTGWEPSCGCNDDPYLEHGAGDGSPVPATVLDPFAGSGTTGMVAQSLSRRAVLIDLNADYLDQALARNRDLPLGLAG